MLTPPAVKLNRRKQAAIAALLTQATIAEAARVADISPHTLTRWMKESAFGAAWREAKSLGLDQAIARLQRISGAAVSALLMVLCDCSCPSAQLRAAETILKYAKRAQEVEHLQARLTELERAAAASHPEALRPAASSVKTKGHGEKFTRRKEAAIAALLTEPSIEQAARSIAVAPATLYMWMKDPEFKKAWREAKSAAFGSATMRLQQVAGQAISIISRVMCGKTTKPMMRIRAASLSLQHGFAAAEEEIEARIITMGDAVEATHAVRNGEQRPHDKIAGSLAKEAA